MNINTTATTAGTAAASPRLAAVSPVSSARRDTRCPQCRQADQVVSAPALYAQEVQRVSIRVSVVSAGRYAVRSQGRGTVRSELADALAPPSTVKSWRAPAVVAGGAVLLAFLAVVDAVQAPAQSTAALLAVAGVVFVVACLLAAVRRRRVLLDGPIVDRAMTYWDAMLWCHRCGGSFVAGSRRLVPMRTPLRRHLVHLARRRAATHGLD